MPKAPADKLVTVAELAKQWSVSVQAVNQMIDAGMPVAQASRRPKRLSLAAAEAFRAGYVGADGRGGTRQGAGRKPGRKKPPGPAAARSRRTTAAPTPQATPPAIDNQEPQPGSLAWERRELAKLKREDLELKAGVRRGEWVNVAIVRRAHVAHVEQFGRDLERFPSKLADRLMSDLQLEPKFRPVVEAAVAEHVAAALKSLAALPSLNPDEVNS